MSLGELSLGGRLESLHTQLRSLVDPDDDIIIKFLQYGVEVQFYSRRRSLAISTIISWEAIDDGVLDIASHQILDIASAFQRHKSYA
jgi:hypothetical protein